VLGQELRNLLVSPALWIMLIIISLLLGYSFIQAVDLFSQASRTALSFPELADGMNPLDGIFVPTFGACYLSQTLLLPFVAIRLIGQDKQSGALKLLLQLPLSPLSLCTVKIMAMLLLWLVSLLPGVSALILWKILGGYIYLPEILLLLTGHGLYAVTIISIAMFAASISDSLPTAAMLCLAVTLGSWVLDFAATGQGGLLGAIGSHSLTNMLRQFENGLFSTTHVISFLSLALFFFLLSVIWLHPGRRLSLKLGKSFAVLTVLCMVVSSAALRPGYWDLTETADIPLIRQIPAL
jgi:ABC-type transport system involved in multi-copper enzyme maturation permease subunit